MTKELTIIGGTGYLSTRVVRLLTEKGVRVTLVARTPQKARDLFGDAVTVLRGDVEDLASLRVALRGTRTLYIHLNTETLDPDQTFYTEREGVRNIVAAAEENGVEHLIQIAGIEALRPDFFTSGVIATQAIRRVGMAAVENSPIPHTFLTCSFFLDSLPRFVDNGSFAVFGDGTSHIHFTDTEQLAEHLFHVVGNTEAHGRSLPVQGREGLGFVEAATRFFATYAPQTKVEHFPLEVIGTLGLPADMAAFFQHVWEVSSGLQEAFIAADVYGSFGEPPLALEAFAAKLRSEA